MGNLAKVCYLAHKMKKLLLAVALAACALGAAQAQTLQETTKPVLPRHRTTAELMAPRVAQQPLISPGKTTGAGWTMPAQMRIPGEFEESQAVLLAWPYPSSANSRYAKTWAALIKTIQQEVPVWVQIDSLVDTPSAVAMLAANGVTLQNGSKFVPIIGEAFWTRDYGPIGFYYGPDDSLGFIDMHYYSGRPKDDNVPAVLAQQMGVRNFRTQLEMEGGNLMVDGFSRLYHSSRVQENNADVFTSHVPAWPAAQTSDTIANVFRQDSLTMPTSLVCDGGTGHIDMYLKLLDDETLVVGQYDSTVTAPDRAIIENNVMLMATNRSTYNRPYKIKRIPMATRNNGTLPTDSVSIDNDPRGFVNGLTVNKTFLFPSFSNTINGNVAGDSMATQFFRKLMPGYRVVPLDARLLTPMGGAFHCITMQIPVENPMTIWHPSLEGTVGNQSNYPLMARIQNHSGIQSAVIKWRKKGQMAYQTVSMANVNQAWHGNIPGANLNSNDTVEYFIQATSNNGKTMTKPYTAPAAHFTFQVAGSQGVANAPALDNFLFMASPNPAHQQTNILFYLNAPAAPEFTLTDMSGRVLQRIAPGAYSEGRYNLTLQTAGLAPGMYLYHMHVVGEGLRTRKLIVY